MKQLVEVGVLEIVSLLAYNAFIILGLFRVRSQGQTGGFPGKGEKMCVETTEMEISPHKAGLFG